MGQELRVVWELEPGKSLKPQQDLPEKIQTDRFDMPERLAAFIDALRWGAITSADARSFQAPFRSGANVEPYQLEPLRRALNSPRANLLLADDVGLGKTIEAGMVIQELFLRHRARTAIIVCPAGLTLKWQDELAEKFGLDFVVVNSETMRQVRRTHGLHANPFTLFPRIVVSMAWLPGQRAQRQLRDAFAAKSRSGADRFAFDILVVDEAHHVAPSSPARTDKLGMERRGYAVDSLRTRAVRELAERAEHRLFLSATPHNGYTESFTALLEMIDPQRFVRGTTFDEKALREVAVRRLKKELRDVKGFAEREVSALPYEPTADEAEAYDRLLAFTRRRDRAVASHGGSRSAKDMATLLLKKRFFSSPVAFARTIDVYRDTRTRGLDVEFDAYYEEILGYDADDLEEGRVDQPETQTLQETKSALPELTRRRPRGPRPTQRVGPPLRSATRFPARRPDRPHRSSAAPDTGVEQRADRRLHRVRRHAALDPRHPPAARLRAGPDLGDRRQHGQRDSRAHPRGLQRGPDQDPGPHPVGHRRGG